MSEPTPNSSRLIVVALAAAAFGLLAQLLFFDAALGINVPIATLALLAAGWMVRDPARPGPRLTDAWLPAAALAFAAFVALRGDATLVSFDILATLTLSGAALASLGGFAVVARPIQQVGLLALRVIGWIFSGGTRVAVALGPVLPHDRLRRGPGRAAPVLRGLLIAVPVGLVFIALFASADAVFARMVDDFLRFDIDLGDTVGRLILALVAAWLAAGALAFTVVAEELPAKAANPDELPLPRLGTIEAVTVLVVVDFLFALFVLLQATYLFGGLDTLQAAGLTYSQYARRGFLELIVGAALAGGLVILLEAIAVRRSRLQVGAGIGLGILTAVVLASAVLRLRLYQEAYGWTELRFYALAAIAWLGIGVVIAIVALATNRMRWLPHGLIVSALVVALAVNVIGPVRFVAEQNVARLLHPELVPADGETGLDVYYLLGLGDDAVPSLVDALPALPKNQSRELGTELQLRRDSPASNLGARTWQAWNLSRERARDMTPAHNLES